MQDNTENSAPSTALIVGVAAVILLAIVFGVSAIFLIRHHRRQRKLHEAKHHDFTTAKTHPCSSPSTDSCTTQHSWPLQHHHQQHPQQMQQHYQSPRYEVPTINPPTLFEVQDNNVTAPPRSELSGIDSKRGELPV